MIPTAAPIPRRLRPAPAARAAAVLAVALAGTLGAAAYGHGHGHGHRRDASGDFDYYLLALSWSPAYCARSGDRGAECAGPSRRGFVVHGLWPQRDRGRLEYCATPVRVPAAVAGGVADLMPDRRLVFHEWKAHGGCSGLTPAAYFGELRTAAASIAIPPLLRAPRAERLVAPRVMVGEFLRANPALRAADVVVACDRGVRPALTEVRVCLDRGLAPRACAAAALAARCRAPLVRVPPLR
jgi:ribonuclease T2